MKIRTVLLSGCAILFSNPALSQQSAESDARAPADSTAESLSPQDIVVTARRREEKLQDVPVAVTAVNNKAIEQQAIFGLQDIKRAAPSLNISQSAGGGRQIPLFTIRGQRQGDTLATLDPSVGIYFGDVLFKRAYGLDQVTFDLNSIEVLKGPQGTLFGLNVPGGNIVFRPNLPTDRLEASVMAGVGNYDYRILEAYINVPLGEGAALRVAGQYRKRDGYIRNIINGEDLQDLNGGGIRASLKLNPTERLESIFVGNYLRSSTNGTGWHLNFFQPTTLTGAPTPIASIYSAASPFGSIVTALNQANSIGFYKIASTADTFAKTTPAWNIANTTSYDIGGDVTVKNIFGFRKYDASGFDDFDGSPLRILENAPAQKGKEISDEFQLLGSTDRLNWILGAYYMREKVDFFTQVSGVLFPALQGTQTPFITGELTTNTSKSLFGSATQVLTDGLSLTLGGRYTWDTRRSRFGQRNSIGFRPGDPTPVGGVSPGEMCAFNPATDPGLAAFRYDPATCRVDVQAKFSKFTYTTSLDWKVAPGKLIYFAHRKGYRAGGFNGRATVSAQLTPFRPDVVLDYELGAKLDFRMDNGMFLRTNLAAYQQNYKDIQRLAPFFLPSGFVSTNVLNAARASIKGFEFETTFIPAKWLELSGFLSHTDPKYKSFITAGVDIAKTATFAGTPRWQAGGTARVNLLTPESFGKTALQLNYYRQAAFPIQDTTDRQPAGLTAAYGLLNGRVEVNDAGGLPINVALFVNNIADKKYSVANYALQYNFGFASYVAGPPRMYGLEVRYTFK